jgi:hypothetical protein
VSGTDIDMGPVDYLLVEWPDQQPTGEALPYLVDLVDRGLIRIVDILFITKGEDGSVAIVELANLGDEFAVFAGASSGLVGEDDVSEAGAALRPGTSAALLVYENAWAIPFANALRRTGAEFVASARIPATDLIAALDAVEA